MTKWYIFPCGHKNLDICIRIWNDSGVIIMDLEEFKNLCKEVKQRLENSHIGW